VFAFKVWSHLIPIAAGTFTFIVACNVLRRLFPPKVVQHEVDGEWKREEEERDQKLREISRILQEKFPK
jgi:hypothetical protein